MLRKERTLKISSPFQRTSPSGFSVAQALTKASKMLSQFTLLRTCDQRRGKTHSYSDLSPLHQNIPLIAPLPPSTFPLGQGLTDPPASG